MARSALAAAAEERQRKLQEYLAAKGKQRSLSSKPYLKAKNNCPNPPPSKSTIRPKKDVPLPGKATRPISIKLQPRPANIPRSQKSKLEPPKPLGPRLTSGCIPSNPNWKPCAGHQQQHRAGPSTGKLSRKTLGSHNTQEPKGAKQPVTRQGNGEHTDSVGSVRGERESLRSFPKEMDKENLPQTLLDSEKTPRLQLWTKSKTKTSCYHQTKSSLASAQALGESSWSRAALKDRATKPFVGGTQTKNPPGKSQQLPRGAVLAKPGDKAPKTVPSHFVQTLSWNQASKKPGVKGTKDIKVGDGKQERPGRAKSLPHAVTGHKEHARPKTCPSLLQGGPDHTQPNIKQDQTLSQPFSRPRMAHVQQESRAVSRRPNVAGGRLTAVVPDTPGLRASRGKGTERSGSCQRQSRAGDHQLTRTRPQSQRQSRAGNHQLTRTCPQSRFPNKTAPQAPAGGSAVRGRGPLNGAQTNPGVKKRITAEDRRKQLEEWQKSKGKIYKRPPMKLTTKRKIIEEMNISFWRSIEKEEEERKSQLELSNKINSTLAECLQLIEGGVLSDEVFSMLSGIPAAEKFAKFWVCKAKFLASKGAFDVAGLYEEAIRSGAAPIQELREVVLNILQDPNRTRDGITADSLVAETNKTLTEELARDMESRRTSYLSPKKREEFPATPQVTKAEQDSHPGIRLQVASIPRGSGGAGRAGHEAGHPRPEVSKD